MGFFTLIASSSPANLAERIGLWHVVFLSWIQPWVMHRSQSFHLDEVSCNLRPAIFSLWVASSSPTKFAERTVWHVLFLSWIIQLWVLHGKQSFPDFDSNSFPKFLNSKYWQMDILVCDWDKHNPFFPYTERYFGSWFRSCLVCDTEFLPWFLCHWPFGNVNLQEIFGLDTNSTPHCWCSFLWREW